MFFTIYGICSSFFLLRIDGIPLNPVYYKYILHKSVQTGYRRKAVDIILRRSLPKLREKLLEALQAVLPIVAIVLVLCFTVAPVSPSILLCFLLGAAMIVVGIMFFTLGAEMSMTPMGERVGAVITRSRKLPLILVLGFLLGFLITISEPDLQVLADQVPSIPSGTLILSVAAGVGLFLVFAFLRMLIGVALPKLLVLFYGLIFLLAAFVPKEFLAVAFDSGGVTTGPMTVPFIMALGVGVSAIRSDRHAADDSFGLVAMCSIGPILAVLTLGIAFRAADSTYIPPVLPEVADSVELWQLFREGLPTYLAEIARSLLPIVLMFGGISAHCPAAGPPHAGAHRRGPCVYLYRPCALSDRRKRGLYARR